MNISEILKSLSVLYAEDDVELRESMTRTRLIHTKAQKLLKSRYDRI